MQAVTRLPIRAAHLPVDEVIVGAKFKDCSAGCRAARRKSCLASKRIGPSGGSPVVCHRGGANFDDRCSGIRVVEEMRLICSRGDVVNIDPHQRIRQVCKGGCPVSSVAGPGCSRAYKMVGGLTGGRHQEQRQHQHHKQNPAGNVFLTFVPHNAPSKRKIDSSGLFVASVEWIALHESWLTHLSGNASTLEKNQSTINGPGPFANGAVSVRISA